MRDEAAVKGAIDQTAARFGSLDIVVNNASAVSLTPIAQTDMKRFRSDASDHSANVCYHFIALRITLGALSRNPLSTRSVRRASLSSTFNTALPPLPKPGPS